MNMIEKEQVKDSLGDYVSRLKDEPTVIIDHGKPIAALWPVRNADLETVSLTTNPDFIELIERSRRRHSTEGGISSKEMREKLGMDT
ncbi:MAG: hypothetical protein ABIH23_30185 [bacterium]